MENNEIKKYVVYQFTCEGNEYYVYNTIDTNEGDITKYFLIKNNKVIEYEYPFNSKDLKEIKEASYNDSIKILSYIQNINIEINHIVEYKEKYYYCNAFYDFNKEKHYSFISIDKYLLPICDININHVFTEIDQQKREEQLMLYNLFLLIKDKGFNDYYLPKPNTWYNIAFMENDVMHRWFTYYTKDEPIINAKYLNVKDEDNNNKLILIENIISITKK